MRRHITSQDAHEHDHAWMDSNHDMSCEERIDCLPIQDGLHHFESAANRLRTIVTCNLGICLEGFDFIVYTAFASIISQLYFPAENALSSTLLVFGGFGVAYIVRPFGGLFWGLYADHHGRRQALAMISVLTGIGTLMIALAPPYVTLGMAAPVIVLLGRIVQGFAASGEFASATAMLVELAPPKHQSFYASTQMASQVITIALASVLVLFLSSTMTPQALQSWGWRTVFALGALIAPLGFYMRAHMSESPEFIATAARPREKKLHLTEMFRQYPAELLCIAGIVVISSAALYMILVFMPVYAVRELGLSTRDVQLTTILCAIVEAPIILLAGALADRVGRLQIMVPAAIAYALVSFPLFSHLIASPSTMAFIVAQLVSVTILGFFTGPMPSAMSELLPTEVRTSGIGIVFNCVGAIFGGLGPFLITAIVGLTGDKAGPAYWAALTGSIGAIAVIVMQRRTT